MKKEIINQMRDELYDTKSCQHDFEKYDVEALAKTNEPFFWMVRELGTTLCNIGFPNIRNGSTMRGAEWR